MFQPSTNPNDTKFFEHRILGTVNLDAPLLGLHPGIIVSGLSSLFRPKPETPKPFDESGGSTHLSSAMGSPEPSLYSAPSNMSLTSTPSPQSTTFISPGLPPRMTYDPNFNPEFPNDVRLKDRGWWKNVVHFVKKHNSEGLMDATTNHIMSHLEFGSVLMDFNCLKVRYENLRKLEDVDDIKHHGFPHVPPQVRFVQYYTICYGYPKKPKDPPPGQMEEGQPEGQVEHHDGREMLAPESDVRSGTSTPRISIEDVSADRQQQEPVNLLGHVPKKDALIPDDLDGDISDASLEMMDPEPMSDEYHTPDGSRAGSPPPGVPVREAPVPPQAPASSGEGPEFTGSSPMKTRSGKFLEDLPDAEDDTGTRSRSNTDITSGQPDAQTETPAEVDAVASAEVADDLASLTLDLPPIPPLPEKPDAPDLDKYTDKDARKQAEKEAKRVQKVYDHAVKNRDKAIKERQKIVEKRRRKRASEAEKQEKEAQKQRQKDEEAHAAAVAVTLEEHKSISDTAAAMVPTPSNATASTVSLGQQPSLSQQPSTLTQETSLASVESSVLSPRLTNTSTNELQRSKSNHSKKPEKPEKPKKERKFCNLPSKINGQMDPKWVQIFMKDADEVAAHTGLFFPGAHYEKLIGDVGDMILGWVQDDRTKRAILEMAD